jgi:hypothetical protein
MSLAVMSLAVMSLAVMSLAVMSLAAETAHIYYIPQSKDTPFHA